MTNPAPPSSEARAPRLIGSSVGIARIDGGGTVAQAATPVARKRQKARPMRRPDDRFMKIPLFEFRER
jgi:hypothetical protein